ncbi:hypothetical protein [Streptomyces bugieae]|uniref:Phosphoadenosine phosphosulphate reductase domain-containing protein n=1 Tax=Streptomyces bugieae TaxID=3098223 RepID=A0ABU7NN14_9ACTN|nr:hypothetical protein [Streptomyces sp. DSM 41528]
MGSRSRTAQTAEHMLPGMPDGVEKKPPKATDDDSWRARTLDEAIARTYELLDQAIVRFSTGEATTVITKGARVGQIVNYGPRVLEGIWGLYSGGRDSVNTAHLLRKYMKDRALFRHFFRGIIHVNTGTAIAETTQHVREAVPAWGMQLTELTPRVNYLDLVLGNVRATTGPNIGRSVWLGFPGPGTLPHSVMYTRLKDQPLQAFRRQMVGSEGTRRKVMYVGGMRWDESDKRFRNAEEVDVDGGIVWVSPVVHWTNAHMREYRARYRCEKTHKHQPHRMCGDEALPVNPVTENLHMSGDCACGVYAKAEEKDERRFFYPEHGAEIDRWEKTVRDAEIPACVWARPHRKASVRRRPAHRPRT